MDISILQFGPFIVYRDSYQKLLTDQCLQNVHADHGLMVCISRNDKHSFRYWVRVNISTLFKVHIMVFDPFPEKKQLRV